jgi:hypothetical protein
MATPNFGQLNSLGSGSVKLPLHDYEVFTYIAAGVANDDQVATVTGYLGGASGINIGTLTFTYVGATNNVATVTLTLP